MLAEIEMICTEYRTAPHTPLNSATCVCWIIISVLNCKWISGVFSLTTITNSNNNKQTKTDGKITFFSITVREAWPGRRNSGKLG